MPNNRAKKSNTFTSILNWVSVIVHYNYICIYMKPLFEATHYSCHKAIFILLQSVLVNSFDLYCREKKLYRVQDKAQFVTNSRPLQRGKAEARLSSKKLRFNFTSYLSNNLLVTLLPSSNVDAADKTVTLTADNTPSTSAPALLAAYCPGPEGTQTNSVLSSSALGHQI